MKAASLDSYCKTGRPGVLLFRSDCTSSGGISLPAAESDFARGWLTAPRACVPEDEFRIMRLRLHPQDVWQELDRPENVRAPAG